MQHHSKCTCNACTKEINKKHNHSPKILYDTCEITENVVGSNEVEEEEKYTRNVQESTRSSGVISLREMAIILPPLHIEINELRGKIGLMLIELDTLRRQIFGTEKKARG